MSDAILVVNAGSSSIKFSLFLERGEALDLLLGGQIESLYTAPRFKAKDAAGGTVGAGPRITAAGSRVPAWVIPTDEELMIARHTRALLAAESSR